MVVADQVSQPCGLEDIARVVQEERVEVPPVYGVTVREGLFTPDNFLCYQGIEGFKKTGNYYLAIGGLHFVDRVMALEINSARRLSSSSQWAITSSGKSVNPSSVKSLIWAADITCGLQGGA